MYESFTRLCLKQARIPRLPTPRFLSGFNAAGIVVNKHRMIGEVEWIFGIDPVLPEKLGDFMGEGQRMIARCSLFGGCTVELVHSQTPAHFQIEENHYFGQAHVVSERIES
jgi:hypothetical protein